MLAKDDDEATPLDLGIQLREKGRGEVDVLLQGYKDKVLRSKKVTSICTRYLAHWLVRMA